jgi:hypothetical protein
MMRFTCDRCGAECPNYYATLNVSETHLTSQGEGLEENYMRNSKHLCTACKVSLQEWFGSDLGLLSEDAWQALREQRVADDAEKAVYIAETRAHP